jgi:hypothetical protein
VLTNLILFSRLNDVIQSEGRLFLVFEFVDKDLKKYFDATEGLLSPQVIKVNSLPAKFISTLVFKKILFPSIF